MRPDHAYDPDARQWDAPAEHGRLCTPRCQALAVESPLNRLHYPDVPCPWCGAQPGEACITVGRRRRRQPRARGLEHPSRLGVVA